LKGCEEYWCDSAQLEAHQAKLNSATEGLVHELTPFFHERLSYAGPLKTAHCLKCGGFCWISHTQKGLIAGGRLLKFRCGTPEAAGFLSPKEAA
jgi:hypothetical protein